MSERPEPSTDFIRSIVADDVAAGKHAGRVATRFPPEPNGYLHIGHAKSIVLNFGVARQWNGTCNLRFDDTNPLTEDMEYVHSIETDVRWLGYSWTEERFASDYFDRLYECAEKLVRDGNAYVDSLSEEEIRAYRGTVTEPGRESPHRGRSVEENLDLLRHMRAGEFPDGAHVLRAKIDMASPNMKMRDPLLYRIRHADHYRTGDTWCIYPMYDFTHCLSDAFEGITHSLCTLEFENNRELYDWILDHVLPEPHPQQIEFARLSLSYTVLSKRRLLQLVEEGHVSGWDDPRMPTISGLRRRGVPPEAIRDFCDRIGVARADNVVDMALLEHSIRDALNTEAPRVLAVLDPLKVVITNYPADSPDGESEELEAPLFPRDVGKPGSRALPFSRELWIEREDFDEDPPKGFRRLSPGREVRLRYGYFIRCDEVVRDEASGEVTELRCTYDPETRGGSAPDGRKPQGTIHWVSAPHAREIEVRLYDRLFTDERPGSDGGAGKEAFTDSLNPDSLLVRRSARLEPAALEAGLLGLAVGRFQFERQGFFYLDPESAGAERPVFNRTVTLRDTWSKRATGPSDREPAGAKPPARPTAKKAGAPPAVPQGPRDPLADLSADARAEVERFATRHDLPAADARILTDDGALRTLFDEAVAAGGEAKSLANWTVNELLGRLGEGSSAADLPFGGRELAELVGLIDDGTISTKIAKEILDEMVERGGSPRKIVAAKGLEQVTDEAELARVIDTVLAQHPDEAARYAAGEAKLHGFFVGQVMRATRGKAAPELVNRLLRERG